MKRSVLIMCIVSAVTLIAPWALTAPVPDEPQFLRVVDNVDIVSIVAKLSVPEGKVPRSVRWLNNDGSAAFPAVRLLRGTDSGPGRSPEIIQEWANVTGETAEWSTMSLVDVGISDGSGLYLEFCFPPGGSRSADNQGTGLGIGYWQDGRGTRCYLGSAKSGWLEGHRTIGLAVECADVCEVASMVLKSSIRDDAESVPLVSTAINSVWPNPANPSTTISFSLRNPSFATMEVYDVRGRRVRALLHESLSSGSHEVEWNGSDDSGLPAGSGVYLVRLSADSMEMMQRVTLLK